jgi:hemoglobin-like flavoprotein
MLSPRQTLLIKLSWSHLTNRLEDFGDKFYEVLFEMDPALREMFSDDMTKQRAKFSGMVNHIVSNIQHADKLDNDLKELGDRHVGYRVKASHYDTIMMAFLVSLEKVLERNWDSETKQAWTVAFVYIVARMKN